MASPQQNESHFDLPNLEEDLGNVDDLDWSFLADAPTSTSPNLISNNLDDSIDDPFAKLLPPLPQPDQEISEAEFFNLVSTHQDEGEELYSEIEFAEELSFQSDWGSEDNEDLTSILSPKDLLAKLRAEDQLDSISEIESEDRIEDLVSLDLPEFDWNDEEAEDDSQYTSFLSPDQASFDQANDDDQLPEFQLPSSGQDSDRFDLSDIPELESDFDWDTEEEEVSGQFTSLLSAEQLTVDEVFAELDASSDSESLLAIESEFSEWDRDAEDPEPLDLANELVIEQIDFTASDSRLDSIPNLILDNEPEFNSELKLQNSADQESVSNSMPNSFNPSSSSDQLSDSSMLDFEDPEVLEEEILFSATTSIVSPNIDDYDMQSESEIGESQNLNYTEADLNTMSRLPDLDLGIVPDLEIPLDNFELEQLKETFTSPESSKTLIPSPTKSSQKEETPNYLAGFSQEFVKSAPKSESLPSLPSLPLPPLPQVSQTPTNAIGSLVGQTQPLAQITVKEFKKAEIKSGEDENEQDWLDSFDEIANDMEWEELQGVKTISIDDTPTTFSSSNQKAAPTSINPPSTVNISTQKLSNPSIKLESSSKSADIFSIEEDSMEWTAILDSDTDFVNEIANIQEQKKGGNKRENNREQSPGIDTNNRFSPSVPVGSVPTQNPLKNLKAPNINWKDYQNPLAIAGAGLASLVLVFGVFGRFTLENGLKIGLFKDAQAKDLKGANLKGGNLERANLRQANLNGANLEGTNLKGAILADADLRGANIKGANLRGAKLNGTKLEFSNKKAASKIDPPDLFMWQLVNVSRAGRNLSGANLDGFNLDSANLRSANLSRAKLTWVNFENASLDGANLSGAEISGASFIRTNLNGANFNNTKWDKDRIPKTDNSTICPNGKKGPCTLR